MTAIGRLSADDVIVFDTEFARIEEALENFSIPVPSSDPTAGITTVSLPGSTVSAGVKIANFLSKLIISDFREQELRNAIVCSDESLNTYTKGLQATYQDGYIDGILKEELFRINSYFRYYETLQQNDPSTSEKDYRALQQESYTALRDAYSRRNAAESYLQIVSRTAVAHGEPKKCFPKKVKFHQRSIVNKPFSATKIKCLQESLKI